jgi:hypothetical protein
VIASSEPDVVVLDDAIGVMAVSMVREIAPRAKVVLVWPSAVVPIGGDARVEPAKILRDLGPAVERVMAPAAGLTETFERPGWIDKVRKDPATLREKLGSAPPTKRPSVTRLQRRGKRLHPTGRRSRATEHDDAEEGIPAPVVVLPVDAGGAEREPILDIGGGTAGGGQVEERSEWNRRLGTLALSGAAAVSALVLALALGGGRVPVSVVRGSGDVPIGVPGFTRPGSAEVGHVGAGSLGGSGLGPVVVVEPGPDQEGSPDADGGLGGNLATPGGSGGADEPAPVEEPGGGDGDGGGDGGGGGGGGGNGGGGNGGGKGSGGGDGGTNKPTGGLPGKSAEHNPHGGPPGQMGITPAQGPGLGANAAANEKPAKHAHKN